jgi:hypothetical protein
MSTLFESVNTDNAKTWNGMKTNSTSLKSTVDLFYTIGSARGKFDSIVNQLASAIGEDKDLAIRTILWARDVREGAGERQTFRDAINFLADNAFLTLDEARRLMCKIPELGRYDDLKVFEGTVLEDEMLAFWSKAIPVDGLAAKWAPRKGALAAKLRGAMNLSPKAYRQTIVANTAVVEQFMCAKNWDGINFSHVPSVAASRYGKAFGRNATKNYEAYKAELVKPESERAPGVKINAKAIYPHSIVQAVRQGDATTASAQWDALPNYMKGAENHGIIPLVDVSGSMTWGDCGGTLKPIDVAIALGLYISERNTGPFKDEFITFHDRPQMMRTKGTLAERVKQMGAAPWGGSTNVIAAFELIVDAAVKANLPASELPRTLLILSDMQFNHCSRHNDSAMDAVTRKFHDAGYERPNIVFWNLNSKGDGVPTTADRFGTALVSGFSPAIMASVMNATDFTPEAIMRKAVMSERYNW